MTNLGAKKKIGAQTALPQPLADGPAAVGLTAFAMQVNAIADQPTICFQTSFVSVRVSRRGACHDVAQTLTKGRDVNLTQRHAQ
jgi:hypothetical protein